MSVQESGLDSSLSGKPRRVASVEGITEYRLENGLRLLLFPDPSRPTVTVNLTVFVGSRHEGYGEAGMAHLLEHMAFKGTPDHRQIPQLLNQRGAQFNGTTSDDRTNYYETLPASDENLEFALRLEADRLVNSVISADDLATEFTVVRNEFERGENSPSRVLLQRVAATAYDWHNYGKATIGNRSDIERVPVEALRTFYQRYYQPDNAMVVVAGRFVEATALALVQRYFGELPCPTRVLPHTYTVEPPSDGERHVTLRRVGDVPLVAAAYRIPAAAHPDFAAVAVLTRLLALQPAGRLYQQLVETSKASSIFAFAQARRDPSLLYVGAELPKDGDVDAALAAVLAAAETLDGNPVSNDEVERARRQLLKEWELSSANTTGIAIALSSWAAQGDWRLYFLYRDRIEAVDAQQVMDVARRYLRRNNRTVGLFLPTQQAERVVVPDTPDIVSMVANYKGREQLAAGEAFDVSPLAIEKRVKRLRLETGTRRDDVGLRVAMLEKRNRGETATLLLRLRYGDVGSLADRANAGEFLAEHMARGTRRLGYQQFRDALDREKTQFGAVGEPGVVQFKLRTKRQHFAAAVELLREILFEPALAADELNVLRREQLAEIEHARSDPQALASNSVRRELTGYSPEDPRYVPTADEAEERVKRLTADDVRDLHERFLSGRHGELAVVGDFAPESLQPLLNSLEAWHGAAPYARLPRPIPEGVGRTRRIIQAADKDNAVLLTAQLTPLSSGDDDYPALVIANYILGGGSLSSRLAERIRQREGLSYGVGSAFSASALDKRAAWQVQANANPANMERLEQIVFEEIRGLLAHGVTEEELARAQEGYLRQLEVARSQDDRLASLLADTLYEGRTMEHHAVVAERIAALTPVQLHESVGRHLRPTEFVTFLAGDFSQVGVSG
jgi:zinc protease